MFTKNQNCVSFFTNMVSDKEVDFQSELSALGSLSFQLVIEDNLFFNYSDLPLPGSNQVFFCHSGLDMELPNKMYSGDKVSFENLVLFQGKIFTVNVKLGISTLEVKSLKGSLIKECRLASDGSGIIDMNAFDDGLYQLWLDGKLYDTFYSSSQTLRPDCKIIVTIDSAVVNKNYQNVPVLDISFSARKAFLEYQIVVSPNRKIEVKEMMVHTVDGESYLGPTETKIMGRQMANTFVSKNAVPVAFNTQNSTQLKLTYSNQFSSREKQLAQTLPSPNLDRMKKLDEDFLFTTIVHI